MRRRMREPRIVVTIVGKSLLKYLNKSSIGDLTCGDLRIPLHINIPLSTGVGIPPTPRRLEPRPPDPAKQISCSVLHRER